MYYKTIHLFDVIDFSNIDYDILIKTIKKSKVHLGYIQHEPRKNEYYTKYLEQKKQVYYSHLEDKESSSPYTTCNNCSFLKHKKA